MEEYQQRVVDEKTALDDKISRLKPFIATEKFFALPVFEQERMNRQLHHMEKYSDVLGERIEAFPK
jgi:hypothetical protein